MKKKWYYEYKNGIYPQRLWVHIGKDLPELIDACFDGCNPPNDGYVGVAYDKAIRKSDDRYGILVSFKSTKVMTMSNMKKKGRWTPSFCMLGMSLF